MFQEALLLDTSVYKNVASGLTIRGQARAEIVSLVAYYLNRFGIEKLASRSAHKLSGGEAQRASLARAFAVQPEILFLDEPFSALDPPTREALIEDFLTVLGETKMSVVIATHDIAEALRISGKMAVMNQGRIAQMGLSKEIIERPANRAVASLSRRKRFCRDEWQKALKAGSKLRWPVNPFWHWGIRHQIRLSSAAFVRNG